MKINTKPLILCLVIPLAVGGIAALLTGSGMDAFETLNQPPLSPAGMAVSGRLDDSVHSDGHCILSGSDIRSIAGEDPASACTVRDPTGVQLPVADFLFQSVRIPIRLHLAGCALATYSCDHGFVLSYIGYRRLSDDSVSDLGSVRRISESWDSSAELMFLEDICPRN